MSAALTTKLLGPGPTQRSEEKLNCLEVSQFVSTLSAQPTYMFLYKPLKEQ